MDVADDIRSQLDPVLLNVRVNAFEAPFDSVNLRHVIAVMQCHDELSDHDVEPGAQAATSDDDRLSFPSIEKDILSGTSLDVLEAILHVGISLELSASRDELVRGEERL